MTSAFVTRGYSGRLSVRGLRKRYTRDKILTNVDGAASITDDILIVEDMVFRDLYTATAFIEENAVELGPAIAVMLHPPKGRAMWLAGARAVNS
jgi:hypothetical protein